jgi:hypothetical protein
MSCEVWAGSEVGEVKEPVQPSMGRITGKEWRGSVKETWRTGHWLIRVWIVAKS